MVKCRSTLEWMLPYRNFRAQWSLVVTLKRCSKPEAKKKFSDILTETHDGVFYPWLWRKPPWMLFLLELWHIHRKTLKAASDNQSTPFHKEGKGQHQNNNMITWDLILQIPICLMTQRQGIVFLLCKRLIVPWMAPKYAF